MQFYLVVDNSGSEPGAWSAMNLQFGNNPLLRPVAPTVVAYNESMIQISWPYADQVTYNPQANVMIIQRSVNDGSWQTLPVAFTAGSYTDSGLMEGNKYAYRGLIQTTLVPTPREAVATTVQWTDYIIEVVSCKDSQNNTIVGAVIVALPEEELLALVQGSISGTDLPVLSYRKANKTNSSGQCNIRVPGGKGKVWLLMIPPSTSIGGHAIAHQPTVEI